MNALKKNLVIISSKNAQIKIKLTATRVQPKSKQFYVAYLYKQNYTLGSNVQLLNNVYQGSAVSLPIYVKDQIKIALQIHNVQLDFIAMGIIVKNKKKRTKYAQVIINVKII